LGRAPVQGGGQALLAFAGDADPGVRRWAIEALYDNVDLVPPSDMARLLSANLAHPDRRVRQTATRLASRVPEGTRRLLYPALARAQPIARTSGLLAEFHSPICSRS
jgi:HEAT repeat protein